MGIFCIDKNSLSYCRIWGNILCDDKAYHMQHLCFIYETPSLLLILPLVEETGSGYMFGYAYPVMYDCSAIIITTGVRRNAVLTNSTNTTKVAGIYYYRHTYNPLRHCLFIQIIFSGSNHNSHCCIDDIWKVRTQCIAVHYASYSTGISSNSLDVVQNLKVRFHV